MLHGEGVARIIVCFMACFFTLAYLLLIPFVGHRARATSLSSAHSDFLSLHRDTAVGALMGGTASVPAEQKFNLNRPILRKAVGDQIFLSP